MTDKKYTYIGLGPHYDLIDGRFVRLPDKPRSEIVIPEPIEFDIGPVREDEYQKLTNRWMESKIYDFLDRSYSLQTSYMNRWSFGDPYHSMVKYHPDDMYPFLGMTKPPRTVPFTQYWIALNGSGTYIPGWKLREQALEYKNGKLLISCWRERQAKRSQAARVIQRAWSRAKLSPFTAVGRRTIRAVFES